MNKLIPLCLAVAVSGCAGLQRIPTPSGRPEIEIRADKKTAMELLANLYSRSGYTIKTANDFSLVAEKPESSMGAAVLFGSRFAATPNVRVSMNFSGIGNTVYIQGRVEMVTNPGSGFENVTDISENSLPMQQALLEAKTLLEGGLVGLVIGKDLSVTDVAPNGPADSAGIKRGDKLEKVGGVAVSSYEAAGALLRGDSGTDVEVACSRNGQIASYVMKRKSWGEIYGRK